jgi:hypothetical protein
MKLTRSLCAVACLLGACHKKSKQGPFPFELTCSKSCQRIHACDDEVDEEECRMSCLDLYGPYGANLNKEYLKELDQCVADARCDDLGVTAPALSCRRDAGERTAVSLKVVELCESLPAAISECGAYAPSEQVCHDSFKIFNDATIKDAIDCLDHPCDELSRCLLATLGTPFMFDDK